MDPKYCQSTDSLFFLENHIFLKIYFMIQLLNYYKFKVCHDKNKAGIAKLMGPNRIENPRGYRWEKMVFSVSFNGYINFKRQNYSKW